MMVCMIHIKNSQLSYWRVEEEKESQSRGDRKLLSVLICRVFFHANHTLQHVYSDSLECAEHELTGLESPRLLDREIQTNE